MSLDHDQPWLTMVNTVLFTTSLTMVDRRINCLVCCKLDLVTWCRPQVQYDDILFVKPQEYIRLVNL